MKKLLFICIVCLCASIQSHAQMLDTTINMSTHKVDANSLFQKSIRQKTAAWLLLGGGAGLAFTGFLIIIDASNKVAFWSSAIQGESTKANTGFVLLLVGGGSMLGSIPLFIGSAINKRRANIMLKDENVFFNSRLNIKEHIVALGIKIDL